VDDTLKRALNWLKQHPHTLNCAVKFGDNLCSCGKKETERDLSRCRDWYTSEEHED